MNERKIVLAFSLLAGCMPVERPDGGQGLLPIGVLAPDIVGTGRDGQPTALSAARGHAAVVYFYPKDETPGCTHEACAFRDAFARYQARHVTIFGVSRDSEADHEAFRANHALPFTLVADVDGRVARAYGVSSVLGMEARVTFLVDKDGRIARIWPNVDPGVHAVKVLEAIDAPAGGNAAP